MNKVYTLKGTASSNRRERVNPQVDTLDHHQDVWIIAGEIGLEICAFG